ncbi:MAG: hypothetical protein QOG36_680 [Actinomycetota bacterium]|nr:hypothetical protein [Actinomycetota bacterium]
MTTLVGLGLGWLVGGIGARPVFVVVGGLPGGAAGVNTVPDVEEEALSGAAVGKSGRLLGAAAMILAARSAGVGFLVRGALRRVQPFRRGAQRPAVHLLGFGPC